MDAVERNDRFLLGARAHIVEDSKEIAWAEKYVRPDPNLKWVLGNFVEADNPNDNGHIFPLEDLKVAQQTIPNKPLNMLHHGNYIVGAYAAAEMLWPENEQAGTDAHPYIEALAAFWRHLFPEEYALVQKAHAEGSLYFCVDPETELLTAEGWKSYDQLRLGEDILTLNTETQVSEWKPLDKVHIHENVPEVVRMEGMMHSSVTTPNHRWWTYRKPHRENVPAGWEWRTTDTLTPETRIPRAMPYADAPEFQKYSDEMVELVAWFWTEGSVQLSKAGLPSHATIGQSQVANPSHFASIERALTKVFGEPGRVREGGLWYRGHERDDGVTYLELSVSVAQELWQHAPFMAVSPAFVRQLTKAQLRLFVDISIAADGSIARADGQIALTQTGGMFANSEQRIRAFEYVCALAGIPTNTTPVGDGWRVCLIRRSDFINPRELAAKGRGFTIQREEYGGTVWCPQTVNGTFLARRRGTVYWTGNSMEAMPQTLNCPAEGCQFKDTAVAYAGRTSDTYCAHMNEPRGKKILNKPVFGGGALIIPPVRPGWRKADVSELSEVIRQNADEAEAVYANLQQTFPHLNPQEWESMMAMVLMQARDVSSKERQDLAKKGHAMPGGEFPITNEADLRNAIKAVGRAKDPTAAKAHVVKRAKALGLTKLLPEGWQ